MPIFVYKAKTSTGNIVSGKFDVVDEKRVIYLLKEQNLFPIEVSKDSVFDQNIKSSMFVKIKRKEIIIFCRQFHTMLNAGINIARCLDLMKRQSSNEHFASILSSILEKVQSGKLLSEALKNHPKVFPVIISSMVEVGEATGNLDDVFERLTQYLEKEEQTRSKVKTAMMYPMIIGIIALLAIAVMMILVVPKFIDLFKSMNMELPYITQLLIDTSNFVRSFKFIIGAPVAIFFLRKGFIRFKESEKGSLFIAESLLKIPYIAGTIRKILASRFTRSLGILLKTGVPLVKSLEITGELVNNPIISKNMEKVKDDVGRGVELSQTIGTIGIFPIMVVQMISIGEESGTLDGMVHKVADYYEEELNTSISRLVSIMEPILILMIASIVGFIVIAMILPIFNMYKGIN